MISSLFNSNFSEVRMGTKKAKGKKKTK